MKQYYQPTRLIIGENTLLELPNLFKKSHQNILLISSNDAPLAELHKKVVSLIIDSGRSLIHFDQVKPNPTTTSIDNCLSMINGKAIDCIVAIGGGSSIDSAKAVNIKQANPEKSWDYLFSKYNSFLDLYKTLPNLIDTIVIPTTSGTGSQVTQAAVLTTGNDKLTIFHQELFPQVAILDPKLTTTLPPRMTAATAFDAFTHAFESYLNDRKTLFSQRDSLEAIKLVVENLPKVLKEPQNIEYRLNLMVADTLAGRALSNAGANTPHPLAEIIGGQTNATHGETLACVYPSFIRNSYDKFESEFNEVAKIFDKNSKEGMLDEVVLQFMNECNIQHNLNELLNNDKDFEIIMNHPALNHLPFGSKDYFQKILNDAKN